MSVAIVLHVLSAVAWVGGMFFAWMVLRPVAGTLLEPPLRLMLWLRVFDRFFPWVWASVLALLASGYWMLFTVFGGFAGAGLHIHLMQALGLLMMVLFMVVYFVFYPALGRAVVAEDWPTGAKNLGRIRRVVGINTLLGVAVIAIGSGGSYL